MPDINRLSEKFFQHPIIKTVFEYDNDAFIVGGFLRDILRGININRIKDIDFALKKPDEIAQKISYKFGGTVVALKKNNYRLVLPDGLTIDFAPLNTEIKYDLKRRDFKFNAMAWSPSKGLLDPFSGISDIKRKVITHILKKNFIDDPVRLIRCYRFSSELCFQIDEGTRAVTRALSGHLRKAVSERITLEFLRILDGRCALKALKEALNDRILNKIIYLNTKGFIENIKNFSIVSAFFNKRPQVFTGAGGISPRALIGLECLLVGSCGDALCLSNQVRKRVEIVKRLYREFKELKKRPSYELFDSAQDALYDVLIVSGRVEFIDEARRFEKIKKRALIDAETIMKITGISEGPELGRILNKLKKLQFEDKIRTPSQAKKIISELYDKERLT